MSEKIILNAELREDLGKGASRRLRREDKVPAIVYGAGKDPQSVSLIHREIIRQWEKEEFYTQILGLSIDGKEEEVIIKDMHRHPFKPLVMHMDLLRIKRGEKLKTHIPLHFINEDSAKGVKQGGGKVNHNITEVEISVLPKDLPEHIEVDVADLDVGDTIHLSDIKLPKGVTLVELSHGESHDQPVVSIQKPSGASEEAAESEEEGGEA